MQNHKSRREFLQKIGLISLAAGSGNFLPVESFGNNSVLVVENHDLASLPAKDLFSVLNMELPELTPVRKALERKGYKQALSALLDYYR
ncbi:MAG TPA: heparinase II/III family protein, partial [Mariniphaga sp.]|nr:heparinase II/III family protein [Mariniphaga sp.]